MASDGMSTMPVATEPRDRMTLGHGTYKTDNAILHPVQAIQQNYHTQQRANDKFMMAKVYGSHLPMRLHMEEKILSQFRRVPGLPSSHLGLETALGLDEDIDFGDYLNTPETSEAMVHPLQEMEKWLGDKPLKRLA